MTHTLIALLVLVLVPVSTLRIGQWKKRQIRVHLFFAEREKEREEKSSRLVLFSQTVVLMSTRVMGALKKKKREAYEREKERERKKEKNLSML